jgi:hypothetical protein
MSDSPIPVEDQSPEDASRVAFRPSARTRKGSYSRQDCFRRSCHHTATSKHFHPLRLLSHIHAGTTSRYFARHAVRPVEPRADRPSEDLATLFCDVATVAASMLCADYLPADPITFSLAGPARSFTILANSPTAAGRALCTCAIQHEVANVYRSRRIFRLRGRRPRRL